MQLSFTHKVLVAILGMIFLMTGAITFFFSLRSRSIAEREIERRVEQTQRVFQNYENEIQNKLLAVNAYISGNSAFIAYMAEAIDNGDRDSLLDQYEEIKGFSKCDFMIVSNPNGEIVASTMVFPEQERQTLANLAKSAIEGPITGHFRSGAELFNLVVSPISSGEYLNGFVFVGYRIDEKSAEEIGKITNCHILLLADEENSFSLVAGYYEDGKRFDQKAQADFIRQLARIQTEAYADFDVDGNAYRGLVGKLLSPTAQPVGRYVTMKSLSREMAVFHAINRGMWVIGLITVALMAPASIWAARRVTRPVNQLVNAIRGVREGNYDEGSIKVQGSDEIGVMATAFKAMVRELREQQELIRFLEKSSRNLSSGERDDPDRTIILGGTQYSLSATGVRDAALLAIKDMGTLPEGFLLGERYEICSVLGRGGMGVVYKAQDRSLDEVVAIKMVHLGSDELVTLLKNETKLARKVTHRNVVRIYDLGDIEGMPFISMELVKGTTLKMLLRRSPQMPLSIGLRISTQVMQGLSAAHAEGIIHGDIKPDNVIINSHGEVKVMDFGVARIAKTRVENESVSGTPAYMPPEQFQGASLDATSDIYSLGVMMFEIFTGRLPFSGASVIEFFQKHLNGAIPVAKEIKPDLPQSLSDVIYRAMAKKAEDRYPTMLAMLSELEDLS